ncbi:hypothetical protein Back2_28830 [Nocardioides baekrokdamisoli]|uniref:Uncharacterized protein n=1 Tax=Nocardioides baekrokdamisoli TaxID=1804624 RepID=A0A3G9IJX9_9ACTN|nr:hypothetical protein Back2_28830 [Nocardioides baekrokdamisoli]
MCGSRSSPATERPDGACETVAKKIRTARHGEAPGRVIAPGTSELLGAPAVDHPPSVCWHCSDLSASHPYREAGETAPRPSAGPFHRSVTLAYPEALLLVIEKIARRV